MILDTRLEADLLHIFLVYFSALGVGMTEPVESWIKRAGERCREIGLSEIGSALIRHAGQEAGHHRLMIDDVHILARNWNQRRGVRPLDSQALLSRSLPPAVTQYRSLHQRVIDGPAPFAQVAIEYEIEALSVRYGPALLCQCKQLLPKEASTGLSFLAEHVALDTGHTQFNERQLERLLDERPQSLQDLIDAGVAALNAYGDFIDACLSAANNFSVPPPGTSTSGHRVESKTAAGGGAGLMARRIILFSREDVMEHRTTAALSSARRPSSEISTRLTILRGTFWRVPEDNWSDVRASWHCPAITGRSPMTFSVAKLWSAPYQPPDWPSIPLPKSAGGSSLRRVTEEA